MCYPQETAPELDVFPIAPLVLLVPLLTAPTPSDQLATEDTQDKVGAAWTAYGQGDVDTARALADEVLAVDEESAWSHLLKGKLEEDAGGYGDEHLDRALELAGDDANILATLGDTWATRYAAVVFSDQSYLAADAARRARDIYTRWQDLAPESGLPLQRMASIKRSGGDHDAAIGLLYGAIAKDPYCGPAHNDLWGYLGSHIPHPRLAAFYESLTYGDYDARARAMACDYQGQVLARLAEQRKWDAAQLAANGDISGKVSTLEVAKETFGRAIDCFHRSAEIDEAYAPTAARKDAFYRVSIVQTLADLDPLGSIRDRRAVPKASLPLSFKRAVESAREALDPLLRANPDDEGLQKDVDKLSFAIFEASGGEGGSAEGMGIIADLWTWATDIVTDRSDWYQNLGFFCRESGRDEESYAAYEKAVALKPDDVRYLNDTALILVYNLKRDHDRAEELLKRSIELGAAEYEASKDDPEQEAFMRSAWGDAMLNLGLLYRLTGRYPEAREAYGKLIEFDGERIDLQDHLVQLTLAEKDPAAIAAMVDDMTTRLGEDDEDGFALWATLRLRAFLNAHPDMEGAAAMLDQINEALLRPEARKPRPKEGGEG